MTFVCIASGPSLSEYQLKVVRQRMSKCTVVSVNDNYRVFPDADILFSADSDWWLYHYDEAALCTLADFRTVKGARANFLLKGGDDPYRPLIECPIHRNPEEIGQSKRTFYGGNSGITAIDFARQMGATKIILLGYDHMHTDKTHWFGDHPPELRTEPIFDYWIENFKHLAEAYERLGIDLVNCSYPTALTHCRQSTIEEEL